MQNDNSTLAPDPRPVDPRQYSHSALYNAEQTRRSVHALCGLWIERRDMADEPTCPTCRAAAERFNHLVF